MKIADNKWFTRIVAAAAIIQTSDSLHLEYPEVGPDKLKELAKAAAADFSMSSHLKP